MNEEEKRNKEMRNDLKHVSDTCEGATGYVNPTLYWLNRNASWTRLYDNVYECSCCKSHVLVAEDKDYKPKYRYCPYCGVVMKGV